MLDRLLVALLGVSTVAVVGVVGGDVLSWRLASAEAEHHAVGAVAPDAPVPPSPSLTPARVMSFPTLRLRETTTPAAEQSTTVRPRTSQPVADPPRAARVPAPIVRTTTPAATTQTISITQANLYQGMPAGLFAQDLATVASTGPDFITLNEAGHRSDAQIRLEGYASYRSTGSPYLAETPVLWRTDRWSEVDAGSRWLTTRKVKWGERAVNWVVLRNAAGQVVSVLSAHPAPTVPRTQGLLPVFVDGLGDLVHELSASGPVLVGGDFNAGYGGPLYPGPGLAAAGLTPTYASLGVPAGGTGDHGGATIDYVFHTSGLTPTAQSTQELSSDHDALLASFILG